MEADFSVLLWPSEYSALTLIQNGWRFEVVSNGLLRPLSFAADLLLARTKTTHLAYSQMGRRSIPPQFGGRLWLGSHALALVKAENGDRALAGRKKALAQSLPNLC